MLESLLDRLPGILVALLVFGLFAWRVLEKRNDPPPPPPGWPPLP